MRLGHVLKYSNILDSIVNINGRASINMIAENENKSSVWPLEPFHFDSDRRTSND